MCPSRLHEVHVDDAREGARLSHEGTFAAFVMDQRNDVHPVDDASERGEPVRVTLEVVVDSIAVDPITGGEKATSR